VGKTRRIRSVKKNNQFWRRASEVFDQRAAEYDQWFDNSLLYRIELEAVREIRTMLAEPKLEIGVGPGRFANDLGVCFGIDPAIEPLRLAKNRGVEVCRAVGEALPFPARCLGTVYVLFSLCFMAAPKLVLKECRRVLKEHGVLVLGMINLDSSWGTMLDAKKGAGHQFYRYATFYNHQTITGWLSEAKFKVVEARSSLLQPPDELHEFESSRDGIVPEAGFTILIATVK